MLEERQANNEFQKNLKAKVAAMEERLALLEAGGNASKVVDNSALAAKGITAL
jgi:hypothetical protein